MRIPEGFDIALGIGMSSFDRIIAALVRTDRFPQVQDFVVDAVTWTLFETRRTDVFLKATVRGTFRLAPARFVLRVRAHLSDVRPSQLLASAVAVDEAVITINGQDVPNVLSPAQQRDLLAAVNQLLVGHPLLDADEILRALRSALGLNLEDQAAENRAINNTFVTLFGAVGDAGYQDSVVILYDLRGRTVVTPTASMLRSGRDVVLGIAPRLLNSRILPAAIRQAFGSLPARVGSGDQKATISRLSLASDGNALRLQASLKAAGHDVFAQGPIHLFYSQPDHTLWVSGRDVSADVAIPDWVVGVVVLTIPLAIGIGIGLGALVVKSVADAVASGIASDTVESAFREGGLIDFGATVGSISFGGEAPTLIVRYLEIDDGALLVGASLYAGAETVRAVGASGADRLRWIQFDNGDLLSIPDAAALIEDGRMVGTGLHTVDFRPGSIRTYLRANPDETERNNLRALPPVDLDLFLLYEHPGVWTGTYLL